MNSSYNYADFIGLNLDVRKSRKIRQSRQVDRLPPHPEPTAKPSVNQQKQVKDNPSV